MYQLRDYQQDAVTAALNHLKYKDKPAIIDVSVGGGKTIIARFIIEKLCAEKKHVIFLANRKKLINQAMERLIESHYLYISTIQSIVNEIDITTPDVIVVDECQYIPNTKETGQFWEFINRFPKVKLLGLSGTCYRTDGGKLNWGDIVYSISYSQLLEKKQVTPITNKAVNTVDLSNIKITLGEYDEKQLTDKMIDPVLIQKSIEAIIKYTGNRKKNLIFCVNIRHATILADIMNANGLYCDVVHSQSNNKEQILDNFQNGLMPRLINVDMLTVGYDNPAIDMITCLRPTKSKQLWEQVLGRMVRLRPNKENGLLLDMSGNLEEHGGLGTPCHDPAKNEVKKKTGKICPVCETFVSPTARECIDCGFVFPEPELREVKHQDEPNMAGSPIFSPETTYNVNEVTYNLHIKKGTDKQSFRVDYYCDYKKISEWLPKNWRLEKFFADRGYKIYEGIDNCSLEDLIVQAENLEKPTKIIVNETERFPRIMEYIYGDKIPFILDDEIIW